MTDTKLGKLTFDTFEDAINWLLDEAVDYELRGRATPVMCLRNAHQRMSDFLFELALETERSVNHGLRMEACTRLMEHGYKILLP